MLPDRCSLGVEFLSKQPEVSRFPPTSLANQKVEHYLFAFFTRHSVRLASCWNLAMLTNKRLHAPISMQSCQHLFVQQLNGSEVYAAAGLYVGVKDHKIGGELSKRLGLKVIGLC